MLLPHTLVYFLINRKLNLQKPQYICTVFCLKHLQKWQCKCQMTFFLFIINCFNMCVSVFEAIFFLYFLLWRNETKVIGCNIPSGTRGIPTHQTPNCTFTLTNETNLGFIPYLQSIWKLWSKDLGVLDVSNGLILVTTSMCSLQICRIIQENLKNETDFVSPISSHKIPDVSGSVSALWKGQEHA